MARLPVHERAEVLWRESGGTATAPQIAARLFEEGYGTVSDNNIRTWKKRHCWAVAFELAEYNAAAVTDPASVSASFEEVADALRLLGVKAARKLSEFVATVQLTEVGQAETVSKIMIDAINAAASLDAGVLARYRASRDAEANRAQGNAGVAGDGALGKPKSHVDTVVAMFTNPPRRPGQ